MTATIVVGHDKRTWTTYRVVDATPEEIATLMNTDSEEALTLAQQLDLDGRLVEENEHADENHDPLYTGNNPAVIECEDDGEADDAEG